MDKITDEILLDYIDGTLSEREMAHITTMLDQDEDLKSRLYFFVNLI